MINSLYNFNKRELNNLPKNTGSGASNKVLRD